MPQSRESLVHPLERRVFLAAANDPGNSLQSDLAAIAASGAWDVATGSANTIVAGIDTGIDYTHEDLYLNVWINQDEIPKSLRHKLRDTDKDGRISFYDLNSRKNARWVDDLNGNGYIDAGDLLATRNSDGSGGWENGDDGGANGYIDDIVGWDFADNDNDPLDTDGHGTHTAGTIGAIGNNGAGITGVNWKVSMMAIRIFDDSGNATTDANIATAIRYSADNGAVVSNNSWGGSLDSRAIYDAIAYAGDKGQLFVVAAGNQGINNDSSFARSYPASYDLPNVVAVAASGNTGRLSYFSNYGATMVDLAAPGENILSTLPGNRYGYESGTSMAAPHVTGALALLLSEHPRLSTVDARARLMGGADHVWSLAGRVASGGMLNLYNTVTGIAGRAITNSPQPIVPGLPWQLFELAGEPTGRFGGTPIA